MWSSAFADLKNTQLFNLDAMQENNANNNNNENTTARNDLNNTNNDYQTESEILKSKSSIIDQRSENSNFLSNILSNSQNFDIEVDDDDDDSEVFDDTIEKSVTNHPLADTLDPNNDTFTSQIGQLSSKTENDDKSNKSEEDIYCFDGDSIDLSSDNISDVAHDSVDKPHSNENLNDLSQKKDDAVGALNEELSQKTVTSEPGESIEKPNIANVNVRTTETESDPYNDSKSFSSNNIDRSKTEDGDKNEWEEPEIDVQLKLPSKEQQDVAASENIDKEQPSSISIGHISESASGSEEMLIGLPQIDNDTNGNNKNNAGNLHAGNLSTAVAEQCSEGQNTQATREQQNLKNDTSSLEPVLETANERATIVEAAIKENNAQHIVKVQQLNKQLKAYKSKIKQQDIKLQQKDELLSSYQSKLDKIDKEKNAIINKLQQSDQDLTNLVQMKEENEELMRSFKSANLRLKRECDEYQTKVSALEKSVVDLNETISKMSHNRVEQIQKLTSEIKDLKEEHKVEMKKLSKSHKTELEEKIEESMEKLSQYKYKAQHTMNEKNSQVSLLQSRISELETECRNHKNEIQRVSTEQSAEKSDLETKVQFFKNELTSIKSDNEHLRDSVNTLRSEKDTLMKDVDLLKNELKRETEKVKSLSKKQSEIIVDKNEYDTLFNNNCSLAEKVRMLQEDLSNFRNSSTNAGSIVVTSTSVHSDPVEEESQVSGEEHLECDAITKGGSKGNLFYMIELEENLEEARFEIRNLYEKLRLSENRSIGAEAEASEARRELESFQKEINRKEKLDPENADFQNTTEYLKNILFQYLSTDIQSERQRLLPVIATVLCFTTEEVNLITEVNQGLGSQSLVSFLGFGNS